MSDDRGLHIAETEPPRPAVPWDHQGEPLDPNAAPPPTGPPLPPGEWTPPEPPPSEPPAAQAARRWRFVPRSLSSRLVLFVVALVLVVVTAAGAATYLALQSFLLDRLGQQVRSTASQSLQSLAFDSGQQRYVHGGQTPWV